MPTVDATVAMISRAFTARRPYGLLLAGRSGSGLHFGQDVVRRNVFDGGAGRSRGGFARAHALLERLQASVGGVEGLLQHAVLGLERRDLLDVRTHVLQLLDPCASLALQFTSAHADAAQGLIVAVREVLHRA